MRRLFLSVLFVSAAAGPAAGFEPESLSILAVENNTGYDIDGVYLSPEESDYYGADLLPDGRYLPDGGEESFFLLPGENGSRGFDLSATDTEGFQYRIEGLEIPPSGPVRAVLSLEHHVYGIPRFETAEFMLENHTVPVFLLFLRPPDTDSWGASVIGSREMFLSGQSVRISIPYMGAAVPYSVFAVDEDFDEYLLEVMTGYSDDSRAADTGQSADSEPVRVFLELDDLAERQ